MRGEGSGQTPAHWAAAAGHDETLSVLLEAEPHALLLRDERGVSLADVAQKEDNHRLQGQLLALEREPYVCVRVHRELVTHRPLSASRGDGERE